MLIKVSKNSSEVGWWAKTPVRIRSGAAQLTA